LGFRRMRTVPREGVLPCIVCCVPLVPFRSVACLLCLLFVLRVPRGRVKRKRRASSPYLRVPKVLL
jgi:hypothetical protein